jgi:hypothetical protein
MYWSGNVESEDSGKPQICPVCGKHFQFRSAMGLHLRTHTGEKPYKCSYCDKAFSQKGNLRIHMRLHTGEMPYKCKVCNREFADASNCRKHQIIHLLWSPLFLGAFYFRDCSVNEISTPTHYAWNFHRKRDVEFNGREFLMTLSLTFKAVNIKGFTVSPQHFPVDNSMFRISPVHMTQDAGFGERRETQHFSTSWSWSGCVPDTPPLAVRLWNITASESNRILAGSWRNKNRQ